MFHIFFMNIITTIYLKMVNVFLIRAECGYLLVDTGYPDDYVPIVKELEKINIALDEIKWIFLTHHHDDHAGAAARLMEETGAVVIAHERAAKPLSEGRSDETDESAVTRRMKMLFSAYMLFHSKFTFPPVNLRNTDILIGSDNDEFLRSIGIAGKIILTPGHTYDSISIVLDNGDAVVGDAAMNIMHIAGAANRPIYQMNRREVFESWQKLIAHGASTIYTGHGKPFNIGKLEKSCRRFAHKAV